MSHVKKVGLMGNMITLPLVFQQKEYYLLVRIKSQNNLSKLHVSVITEEKGSKIYESLVFDSDGHTVSYVEKPAYSLPKELFNEIIKTVEKYLRTFQQSQN